MAYHLLDTLLWVANWPNYSESFMVQRRPMPAINGNLNRVLKCLSNWTSIIPDLKTSTIGQLQTHEGLAMGANHSTSTTKSTIHPSELSGNIVPQISELMVDNFLKSKSHANLRHTHDVLEQWHALAFLVAAFRPVS